MMKKRASHSRAIFLEIILNLLLFTACAAICLQLFVKAYVQNTDSRMLTEASMKAQSMAEVFKHERGQAVPIAQCFDGIVSAGSVLVFYDREWNPSSKSEAYYRLTCDIQNENGLKKGDIRAFKGDQEIFLITAKVNGVD